MNADTRTRSQVSSFDAMTRWIVIAPIVALVLSMIAGPAFSLALKLTLHADREAGPETTGKYMAMPGSIKEKLNVVTSSDYEAIFVPSHLTERSFQFASYLFFQGPVLLTGTSTDMVPDKASRESGFTGYSRLGYVSFFPVFLFYLFLLCLLAVFRMIFKNPGQVLWFIISLSLAWLIWAIILSLFSGMLTRPAEEVSNQVLGRTGNPINFVTSFWQILWAPLKVFLTGMIFWVLTVGIKKEKAPGAPSGNPV